MDQRCLGISESTENSGALAFPFSPSPHGQAKDLPRRFNNSAREESQQSEVKSSEKERKVIENQYPVAAAAPATLDFLLSSLSLSLLLYFPSSEFYKGYCTDRCDPHLRNSCVTPPHLPPFSITTKAAVVITSPLASHLNSTRCCGGELDRRDNPCFAFIMSRR